MLRLAKAKSKASRQEPASISFKASLYTSIARLQRETERGGETELTYEKGVVFWLVTPDFRERCLGWFDSIDSNQIKRSRTFQQNRRGKKNERMILLQDLVVDCSQECFNKPLALTLFEGSFSKHNSKKDRSA